MNTIRSKANVVWPSKSKKITCDSIALNIFKLLVRLTQEREGIKKTVYDEILYTLANYSMQICNLRKSMQIPREYVEFLNEFIILTKKELNKIPSKNNQLKKLETKSSDILKGHLLDAAKQLESGDIKNYQETLENVTLWKQNLIELGDYVKLDNKDEAVAELFLTLFIETKPLLSENLNNETIKKIRKSIKDINITNYFAKLNIELNKNEPITENIYLKIMQETLTKESGALNKKEKKIDFVIQTVSGKRSKSDKRYQQNSDPILVENNTQQQYQRNSFRANNSQTIDKSKEKVYVAIQRVVFFLDQKGSLNRISEIFKELDKTDTDTTDMRDKNATSNTEHFSDVQTNTSNKKFLHKLNLWADKFESFTNLFVKHLEYDICELEDLIEMNVDKNSFENLKLILTSPEELNIDDNMTEISIEDHNKEKIEGVTNEEMERNIAPVNETEDESIEGIEQETPTGKENGNSVNDHNHNEISSDNIPEERNDTDKKKFNILCNFEEIKEKVESVTGFEDKKNILVAVIQDIQKITVNDTEMSKKVVLVNKLEGLLVVESLDYLENLDRKVEHYKAYAEQFPFPETIRTYDVRKKEIESLRELLNNLPEINYDCIDARRKFVMEQINEALNDLENKAKKNSKMLSILKELNKLEKETASGDLSSKLTKTMQLVQQINTINESHHRVDSKKKEIFKNIHHIEEGFYNSKYNEITESKKTLDKLLQSIQDKSSVHPESDKQESFTEEDMELFKEYKKESEQLDNLITELMAGVKNCLQTTDIIVAPTLKRRQTLKKINNNLQTLKLKLTEKDFLEQENIIKQLKEDVGKKKHLIDSDVFKEILNKIFLCKEFINQTQNFSELDERKKALSDEILHVLMSLDKDLADRVSNKKPSENIIELNRYFSIDEGLPQENDQLIDYVHNKVESVESQIDSYFGNYSSVDYYIIEETLQLLMEKLDQVNSKDHDLVSKLVSTMNYIKQCISNLESNASRESFYKDNDD